MSPPEFMPFPTDALPAPLADFVRAAAEATNCDETYFILPMLSALGASIGTTRRIQIKNRWFEFPTIWSALVAASGTQKSVGLQEAIEPLHELQRLAFSEHEQALELYQHHKEEYDQAIAQRRKRRHPAGEELPIPPKPPEPRRFVVQDITVEALAPILRANPRGLLLGCDELSGWFKGFDAYKSARGADVAHWLEMFGGRSMTVDRKGGEPRTIHVRCAAVCVAGTIQPGVLANILGPDQFESGLAARFLFAMPPRRKREWSEQDIPADVLRRYGMVIRGLAALTHAEGSESEPQIVAPCPEAKRLFVAFYNSIAAAAAAQSDESISAALSKLEAYALRIALIVHCVREAIADPTLRHPFLLDAESMRAGIRIAQWFTAEVPRVYAEFRLSDTERERRTLVEKVRREGGRMSVRELHRSSQQRYAKAEDAEAALERLARAGLGAWAQSPTGGRPSKVFVLHDGSDSDKTPGHSPPPSVTVTSVSDSSSEQDRSPPVVSPTATA